MVSLGYNMEKIKAAKTCGCGEYYTVFCDNILRASGISTFTSL